MKRVLPWAAAGSLAVVFACGAPARPVEPRFVEVAHVHRARCGACHAPVQPGDRDRATLERALAKHRARVKLSEDDWQLLIAYLAR